MADTPDNQATDTAQGKKGISGLIVFVLISLVAVGAGVATPFLIPAESKETAEKQDRDSDVKRLNLAEPSGEVAFLHFGDEGEAVVVNLNDERMSRYLRLGMTLQVDKAQQEQIAALLTERKLILHDWLLRYLSDKDMEEIRGAAGQNRLRREIMDSFNTLLFPDGYDRIHDILFEEFNVQ